MYRKLYLFILATFCLFSATRSFADVTLSTSAIAAGNMPQGTNNSVVYIVKMDVTLTSVNVNSIQFTLTGTHDNNDINNVNIFYNASAPSLTGASQVGVTPGLFAAPHTYNASFNYVGQQTVAAGASAYFIISVNVDVAATSGNTVKVNGLANPVTFGYTTSPTVTNNQTDIAGTQTIQAAGVTLTTSAVAASNVAQGTNNSIVYVVKMDVATLPVSVNSMQFTLTGTYDNDDIPTINIFFNPSTPSLTGASQVATIGGLFAAPHTYNAPFNYVGQQNIAAGGSGYFILTFNTSAAATSGNTVKVNGLTNPVTFGYTTSPTVTNNQTDIAGTQTIQGAGVILTSSAVAASNVAQGTNNSIVYVVKMDVATLPVSVNSMQFTLTGTYDNDDIPTINIFFNPSTPSLTGASQVATIGGLFAAPHTYNAPFNYVGQQNIAAGGSGYFILTFNTSAAATSGNTVKVNGLTNPVTFGYTTSPTVTNNQTDIAGTQTIQGAGVTLTSSAVAASNVAQGTNNSIVYIVKMDVAGLPVSVNSMQFTLTGTYDNDDIPTINIFFNPSTPSLTGASQVATIGGLFAAPHTYNEPFNFVGQQNIAAGGSGYFILTFNTSNAATSGNTVKVNGLTNPVTFSYTTSPTVTNNQTDIAGTQTIQAAGVTLTSSAVAAGNITRGSSNNIVYIVKMDVTSLPVSVNSIQFTLTGTHDNNDLTVANVFFNASTPSLTGATQMATTSALFAAPHTYNAPFNFVGSQSIAAGGSGYFILTVNTDPTATLNNTVKLDGAANPVTFGFATAPPVTNNQTNAAGTQTITSPVPLTLISFTGSVVNSQKIQLQWVTANEFATKDFEVEWSGDGISFSKAAVLPAAGNSSLNVSYSYIHKMIVDGSNFYRLKMIDKDGRFTYSPVIKINIAISVDKITVFPNPVIDVLKFRIQALINETIIFQLQSADGKIIASKSFIVIKGSNLGTWNLQQLAPGNYFISSGNKHFESVKIIKN